MSAHPHVTLGPVAPDVSKKAALVLAGGLGTRLRSAVPDLPKCMAPVADMPFLGHVIAFLQEQGVQHLIFSLGYLHETIEAYLRERLPEGGYQVVIEPEPLGTGGAIRLALQQTTADNLIIVNGDTLFRVSLDELLSFHLSQQACCTLALKPMTRFNRYGCVETDKDGHILSFREKQYYEQGLINGGVYVLHRKSFLELPFPVAFSFESGFLETYCSAVKLCGLVQDGYFIDIGIPEDFERAQSELSTY